VRRLLLLATLCCCFLTVAVYAFKGTADATITSYISFQGKLTNPDGTNVSNNSYSLRFRIYTDPAADTGTCANTCKWEETKSVTVTDGLFQTNLGDATALPGSVNFNGSTLYLGVKVAADAEMTPRVQLTAVPQAFNAENLGGIAASGFAQLSPGSQQTGNLNISGTITSGAINGVIIGSTVQPSTVGALTIQSNGSSPLTLTGGASSTWSTTGALTIQASGTNILTLNTTGAGTIELGNTNTTTLNIGGTAGATINIATGNVAHTLHIGDGGSSTNQIITVGSTNTGSTTAIQGGAVSVLSGANITLGVVDTTATQLILDTKTSAGDPTGVGTGGGLYYNSSNDRFRCYEGSTWKNCTTGTVRTTADRQTTTTAYGDITGLTVPVNANTDYNFSCSLIFQSAATTTGFAFSVNGPASPTLIDYTVSYQTTANATASTALMTVRHDTAYNAMAAVASTIAATTNLRATIEGTLSNGATAGTLAIRFLSEVNASAITVKKGSYCNIY